MPFRNAPRVSLPRRSFFNTFDPSPRNVWPGAKGAMVATRASEHAADHRGGRVHFHSVALWMMRRENDAPRRGESRAATSRRNGRQLSHGAARNQPVSGAGRASRPRLRGGRGREEGGGGKTEKLFRFRESKPFPLASGNNAQPSESPIDRSIDLITQRINLGSAPFFGGGREAAFVSRRCVGRRP
jgi:hypothetical protein